MTHFSTAMSTARRCLQNLWAIGSALMLLCGYAAAQETVASDLPGATVEDVLAIARRLSPDLAMRALDMEASRARVDIAGSLDDPSLRITSDEIDRVSGPRQNKMIYSIEQTVPLWGRRDLKRAVAEAEAKRRQADAQSAEVELVEKVKIAFAQYYWTDRAIRTTEELHRVVHSIARTARDRYIQGRGSQQDVFKAEVENTRTATELVRLDSARSAARGRLNALLARPIDAPLAEPSQLRPLPQQEALDLSALLERARRTSPRLAAENADIAAAAGNSQLADKAWYPDPTLSVGAIDRTGNGPNGYMASIDFKIPLQWGLRAAQQREAAAAIGAAHARRQSVELDIQGDLAEAAAALNGSRRIDNLIRTQLLPQREALLGSATVGYGLARTDLADVLHAQHDLADIRIELLGVEFDQQRQLAAIERLVGGEL